MVSKHRVAVLALPDAAPFDVAVPLEAFLRADQLGLGYDVRLCGDAMVVGPFGTWIPTEPLAWARRADTIVVPGRYDEDAPAPQDVLELLRRASGRRVRLLSMCVGAFVLAQAGVLDGGPATTHWYLADLLATRYPNVAVDPAPLLVDRGDVLTSAGLAAGIDACLHVVRCDHGAAAAARLARVLVAAPHRTGGQAQFIEPTPRRPAQEPDLAELRRWMLEHLRDPQPLHRLARRAGCSERTLLRRFRADTGQAPLQWLTAQRLLAARVRLETTDETVEAVARRTGLGSAANMRALFRHHLATTPAAYRAAFRAAA